MVSERIREFREALEDAVAERREPFAHGTGLFVDSLPDVYDLNYLRAERPAAAAQLAADADSLMQPFLHRKVVLRDADQAAGFRRLGWTVTTHLVMAHHHDPDRRVDTASVREIPFEQLAETRYELSAGEYGGDAALAERLNDAKRRVGSVVPQQWFAAFAGDRIASYCELRSRDGVGQIEDVNTLPEFRGRGLGRAVVQHALDEAHRDHELVFLEALEEDWPRELYAKLGFEVVDRRHLCLLPPSPLTRLRLVTPRLELRLGSVAELRALALLAREGVHPPEEMPFEVAWTDALGSPAFVDDFVAFHLSRLAQSTPEAWRLELLAFHAGEPVGTQGIGADKFAQRHEVLTGSWLGARWQGQGLGTEMRAAVLTLAFQGLGAQAALSAAWEHNPSSLAVSRKLGYVETGTKLAHPRGEPLLHRVLRLERSAFVPPVPVEIEGLAAVLPLLGAP